MGALGRTLVKHFDEVLVLGHHLRVPSAKAALRLTALDDLLLIQVMRVAEIPGLFLRPERGLVLPGHTVSGVVLVFQLRETPRVSHRAVEALELRLRGEMLRVLVVSLEHALGVVGKRRLRAGSALSNRLRSLLRVLGDVLQPFL